MDIFSYQATQQQGTRCDISTTTGMLFVIGIVLATVFAVQLLDQLQSILMETAVTWANLGIGWLFSIIGSYVPS